MRVPQGALYSGAHRQSAALVGGFHLLETAPPPDKFRCKDGNSEHEKGKKEGHPAASLRRLRRYGGKRPADRGDRAAQFPTLQVPIIVRNHVRNLQQVEIAVKEAEAEGGTVVHTFVDSSLREAIQRLGRKHGVVMIDLMGPLLQQMALQAAPSPRAGRLVP